MAAVFPILVALAVPLAAAELQFNRDVRPILSDKCYLCHGPDAAAKRIPLRLDSEAAAKADLGGRRAIVPGDAARSSLMQRITHANKAMRMPPAHSGLTLTDAEVATLRTWIDQGAKWQPHWSFIPPARPELPAVAAPTPIDRFIHERLAREQLTPSTEAPRATLIRRVSLDLTGIPPSPAEVDGFVSGRDSYERVVDRLLLSPRYGERIAARWLDAARYADSNGYQYDGERYMWRWRDWVIDALNRNQPFDEFVRDQIAGDLLPDATLDQKIATGFNRNHRINTEDGIIPEEYAVEYVVDRVETASTVLLGLTTGCARCHNHKYDPITQLEFYQLFAYFNNVPELGRGMKYGNSPPLAAAPTREQQAAMAALDAKIAAAGKQLRAESKAVERAEAEFVKQLRGGTRFAPSEGLLASYVNVTAPRTLDPETANIDINDPLTVSAWVTAGAAVDGSIVSRMADDPRGKGWGLHLDKGKVHFHLTSVWADDALRIESEETLAPGRHHILATYDGSKAASNMTLVIDGRLAKFKILLDTLYRPFGNAGKPYKTPLRVGAGWGPGRQFQGTIEDLRLYGRVLNADEVAVLAVPSTLEEIARRTERTDAERRALRWAALQSNAVWQQLSALRTEREKLTRSFPDVMVMAESPQPKTTYLLDRGAYDAKRDAVSPGLPAVLPGLPAGAPNNRLGFAQWLTAPSNPLLARVTVNRLWQHLFGVGLVKTTEDFGSQGEWPSHPELLDWLATEFVRTGWDTKALLKQMVMSAAYRQSSQATPGLIAHDPENRLLARGPRVRLPAEMIRDQALAAAGLLVERIGGPSVKPYQPDGLWTELAMQDMDYVQDHGANLYRRGLYTFWKRTIAPPSMVNFDAAGREACVVRETRTNTPLQALNLMNDVTFVEAARFIGQRMLNEGGPSADARLGYGMKLVLARGPSAAEMEVLRGSLAYHRDYFATHDPAAYLALGESKADAKLDRRELAAYASVASLILNLDEAVTKE